MVTSCTSSPAAEPRDRPGKEDDRTSTKPTPPPTPVKLSISPGNKAVDVPPGDPITVAAVGGKLTRVVLTNEAGEQVKGQLSPDATTWQVAEPLGYDKTYTAKATGEGTDGKPASLTSTFTTVQPRLRADLSMNPLDGQKVGVGQPLAFYFDVDITDKAAAQRAIQITSTPAVEGAFYWFSDSEVHWRPKQYWPAGTKISIKASIYGKNFGEGVFGNDDRVAGVTVGDAVVAVADGGTHQMIVKVNGKVARTIPIAMGKPGHETPFGTYVVMSEHTDYTMDSGTYGVPADSPLGYRTHVDVASRMSNSGIFYHSAPWSVGDQGHRNVSHGCINMSTENAAWMQSISNKGDVVVVQHSGGPRLESWDGLGDWQIPWPEWTKGGHR
ncbi:MAG: L,D-transpeptidase family protein [Actinophytocola sp.]|uniref:L,D-transpeptidase n=1 Tax=Actinophytocola sp. TaxID=1872138 RepID=UPI00132BAE95|nr:Ig-like domain-containing protein [Actinophytocola sp.]MPZ79642.1 L,D-transpeptidase family protein [Actinophytocola sp.]